MLSHTTNANTYLEKKNTKITCQSKKNLVTFME